MTFPMLASYLLHMKILHICSMAILISLDILISSWENDWKCLLMYLKVSNTSDIFLAVRFFYP